MFPFVTYSLDDWCFTLSEVLCAFESEVLILGLCDTIARLLLGDHLTAHLGHTDRLGLLVACSEKVPIRMAYALLFQ